MRTLVIAIVASLLLVGSANADLTCSSAMTLDTLVTCIRDQMPKAGGLAHRRQSDAARIV